jgi:type VI secretion system ImpM family protein
MGLFSSSRSAPPKFGCFGKLPSYGDFLSLNADGPEAQALAAWLHDGVGSMPSAPAASADQVISFVWHPAGARRTLIGALWPSADAAGRRFPFAIFAPFPDSQFASHGPRRVLAAEPVWRQVSEIYSHLSTRTNVRDQYAMIDVAPTALPDAREVERTFAERARSTGLRRDDAAAFGVELQEVAQYAAALRNSPEVPDFALRVRLAGGRDPAAEAAVWLRVILARLEIDELDAAIFLRVTRTGGQTLFVFHRTLASTDLGFLLAPGEGYRFADSVGFRGVAASAPDARAIESFQRSWTSGVPTLAGLLDLAGHALPPAESGAAAPAVFPAIPSAAEAPGRELPPAPPPAVSDTAFAETLTDSNTITGELAEALGAAPAAPAAATGPITGSTDAPTTGPVASAAPIAAPITDESPGGVSGTDVIVARVRELAAGALLPGRLVRASTSAASASATGEAAAGTTVLLYLEEGGLPAILAGIDGEAMRRIERGVADHAEARRLIDELRRLHKAAEDRLQREVDAACARTPRPGLGT